MSLETPITCHCGHRVLQKDVLQRGRFPRLLSPGFIYVKFRCSRCKRLGERFIPCEKWQEASTQAPGEELTPSERQRFDAMGGIDLDEVIDFHFQLHSRPLADLITAGEV